MSGHHHGVALHRDGLGNLEMEPTFSMQVAAKQSLGLKRKLPVDFQLWSNYRSGSAEGRREIVHADSAGDTRTGNVFLRAQWSRSRGTQS